MFYTRHFEPQSEDYSTRSIAAGTFNARRPLTHDKVTQVTSGTELLGLYKTEI